MNLSTFIVAAVIAALAAAAVVVQIRNRKNGKGSCSCGCSGSGCSRNCGGCLDEANQNPYNEEKSSEEK